MLTDEDIAMLRAADARGREAMARAVAESDTAPLPPSLGSLTGYTPVSMVAQYCAGGCNRQVAKRGGYCDDCAAIQQFKLRAFRLLDAHRSLPDLPWCRIELPEYHAKVALARSVAQRLPDATRGTALATIDKAAWKRDTKALLLLGPTGIGKSKVALAIAHRVLDAALRPSMSADDVRFAAGVRWANGLDVAHAHAQHRLGGGEPEVIATAKRASLLVLDEIGYEDDRAGSIVVRDLIYARYDASRPTIATSGLTMRELVARYGAATVRRLQELGSVVDLHGAQQVRRAG
jgi:hypothetical protein